MSSSSEFIYPRRLFIRGILKPAIAALFNLTTDLTIYGKENIPAEGPLLVVGNHFSFFDPLAVIRALPFPLEFLGGNRNPAAPRYTTIFPRLWGVYFVFRGTGSTYALKAAESVISQKGVLCIFPEGGSWAQVLRPPRPGTAYIAARTGAKILPIGLDGFTEVMKKGRDSKEKPPTTIRIGKPFGPFSVSGRGRQRREQLDEIGHEIMRRIAELIPGERRGHYSDDPAIREAARGTEIYPWDTMTELDFRGGEHLKDQEEA